MGWEHIKSQSGAETPQVPVEDEFSMTNLLEHEEVMVGDSLAVTGSSGLNSWTT